MATAAAVIGIAGLGLQAYGMYSQYQAGKAAARAQKKAAYENAALLEANARAIEEQTTDDAGRFRKEGEAFQSTQRAAIGASGVDLEGSPLLVMKETQANLLKDEKRIFDTGMLQAWNEREKARIARETGQLYQDVGRYQGYATLLTGGGNIATSAYTMWNAYGNKK